MGKLTPDQARDNFDKQVHYHVNIMLAQYRIAIKRRV